ncbi:hypothetical protein MY11210_006033 [Beauveria gryllotalpidicola]
MRLSSWLSAAVTAFVVMPLAAMAADGPIWTYTPATVEEEKPYPPKNMLTWKYYKKPTTFYYNLTSDTASDTNWLGVFHDYGGLPVNGTKGMDPALWVYAPGEKGTVRLETEKLPKGPYKAYLMARDSYEPIVPPVDFNTGKWDLVRFFTHTQTIRPARIGEYWTYDMSGMVNIASDVKNYYFLIYCSGDRWAHVTRGGILYGKPTKRSRRPTNLAVKVKTRRGLHHYIEVVIPVRKAHEPLATRVRIMSMNLWKGGAMVDEFHTKQIDQISKADVDIIGLQETEGTHALRIARGLGWHAHQTADASIISRYPIVEALNATTTTSKAAAVRIALDGDRRQIIVWAAHLSEQSYGPYGLCFEGKDGAAVLQAEHDSGRAAEARELAAAIKPYLADADKVPVVLAADFHSPSHLDYTDASAGMHCGAGAVAWPASRFMAEAGLKDSYREAHPDPVTHPGITWSPIILNNTDYDNRPEPKDRIDFVYYAGGLRIVDSKPWASENPKPKPYPRHRKNSWPSDHRAPVTTFELALANETKGGS